MSRLADALQLLADTEAVNRQRFIRIERMDCIHDRIEACFVHRNEHALGIILIVQHHRHRDRAL